MRQSPTPPEPSRPEQVGDTDFALAPARASQFGKKLFLPVDFQRDLSGAPDTYTPLTRTSPMISSARYRHGGEGFQLSRTRVAGEFMNCPCCFVIRAKEGAQNFPFPTFRVNIAADQRLKKIFDIFRKAGVPAPISKKAGRPLIPFDHPKMEDWRDPLEGGLKWQDPVTQCVVQGAPDDIWQDPETGLLHVVEYKSTYRTDDPQLVGSAMEAYMRQVEFYQFLLRKNGFKVSDRAFVLFVNANPHADLEKEVFDPTGSFYHMPHHPPVLRSFLGNTEWIPEALQEINQLLRQEELPPHSSGCDHARFIQRDRLVHLKRGTMKEIRKIEMTEEMRSRILAAIEPVIFDQDERTFDVNDPFESVEKIREGIRGRISYMTMHARMVDHLAEVTEGSELSKLLQKRVKQDFDLIAANALQRSIRRHGATGTEEQRQQEAEALLDHDISQLKALDQLKRLAHKQVATGYAREYLDDEILRLVREEYPRLQSGSDEPLEPETITKALTSHLLKIMIEADFYGDAKHRIKTFGLFWKREKELIATLPDSIRQLRGDCDKAYDAYLRFTVLSELDEKMFLLVAQDTIMGLEEAQGLDVPVVDTMLDLLPEVITKITREARINRRNLSDAELKEQLAPHLGPLYTRAKSLVVGREYIEIQSSDESTRQNALKFLEKRVKERSAEITKQAVPDQFVQSIVEETQEFISW